MRTKIFLTLFFLLLAIPSAKAISYCGSGSANSCEEWIYDVKIDGMNKTSDCSAYSNYTGTVFNLAQGSTYSVVVRGRTTNSWNECIKLWVDWNHNGNFSDSGEELDLGCLVIGDGGYGGSLTVPTGAMTGDTGMRVQLRYDQAPTPCGVFDYGETEDYTVNIGNCGCSWFTCNRYCGEKSTHLCLSDAGCTGAITTTTTSIPTTTTIHANYTCSNLKDCSVYDSSYAGTMGSSFCGVYNFLVCIGSPFTYMLLLFVVSLLIISIFALFYYILARQN
jgi:hypothetical protein